MKKSQVRVCGRLVAASALIGAFASCGGGERPAVEGERVGKKDDGGPGSSGGVPELTVSPLKNGELFIGDDGFVSCGTQAPPIVLTLTNSTNRIVDFKATLAAGTDKYKIVPEAGGVPANGKTSIQLTPNPIPPVSEVTNDLYAGTLEIATKPSVPPITIRIHQTARGAIITSGSSNGIDFGLAKIGTPATMPFSLTNVGNADVTATVAVGTAFYKIDGAPSSPLTVAAGATGSKPISFAPTDPVDYPDTLTLTYANAVHCKAPPATIALKGKGNLFVGVTPPTLAFGQVDCAADPPSFQTVTIESSIATTFTAVFEQPNSAFSLADKNGAPINQGQTVSMPAGTYALRVVPNRITRPALSMAVDGYGNTLSITAAADGNIPHKVPLRMTARGAILNFGAPTLAVPGSQGQVAHSPVSIVNTGNIPGAFSLSVSGRNGTSDGEAMATFAPTPASETAPVGTKGVTLVTTMPASANSFRYGTLTLSSSAVLCADLPPGLLLTAQTGAGRNVTTNFASLDFSTVNCGETGSPKTLTIKSAVETTVSVSLSAGGDRFTVTQNDGPTYSPVPDPIPMTAGAEYTIRVAPKTIAIPAPASNDVGGELTISSPADTTLKIPLSMTSRGARFVFQPTTIHQPSGTYDFTLRNDGNAPGEYTLSATGGTITGVNTTGSLLPKGQAGDATVGAKIQKTGDGAIRVSTTSVLCAPLPADITMTTPAPPP
jgi:hypothetical protein